MTGVGMQLGGCRNYTADSAERFTFDAISQSLMSFRFNPTNEKSWHRNCKVSCVSKILDWLVI